jgi:hypothetical protein
MDRKKLIIIIVVAFAIFILLIGSAFLIYYFNHRQGAPKASSPIATSSVNNNGDKVSSTVLSNATSSEKVDKSFIKKLIMGESATSSKIENTNISDIYKSVNDCASLTDENKKNDCVSLWAEYKNDSSLCSKATDSGRQLCEDKVYWAKAVANKDMSICVNIKNSDYKYSCITKIVDEAGFVEKDCLSLPSAEDLICTTYISVFKASSVSDCDSIIDPNIKKACRNRFYADLKK